MIRRKGNVYIAVLLVLVVFVVLAMLGVIGNTQKPEVPVKIVDPQLVELEEKCRDLQNSVTYFRDGWLGQTDLTNTQYAKIQELKTKYEELYVSRLETKIATQQGEQIELPKEPKPLTLVDIIPDIKAGVVHLDCPRRQGSAFVVGPRLLVTARHCVEGVTDFRITTDDGHVLHATRAISSEKHDAAFIRIDDLTCIAEERGTLEHKVVLHVLKLGNIAECQLGQRIITIGSAYGKVNINSVTLGIISGLDRDYDELNVNIYGEHDYGWSVAFQSSAPGFPGNSGGPLFTDDGLVVGVLVGGFDVTLIIVMPIDLVKEDIKHILDMFAQDRYYHEEEPDYAEEAWGY